MRARIAERRRKCGFLPTVRIPAHSEVRGGDTPMQYPRRVIETLEPRTLFSTYYVSTAGNNGSAGTSSGAAWQTLQHAADHVAAGDMVIVLPGNYVGFDLRASGTA